MSTENDILEAVKDLVEAAGISGVTVVIRDRQVAWLDEDDDSGDTLPLVILNSAGVSTENYILNGQVTRRYRITVGLVEAGNNLPELNLSTHQTNRQLVRNALNRVNNPPVLPTVTGAWDLELKDLPPADPGQLDHGYRYTGIEVSYLVTEAS